MQAVILAGGFGTRLAEESDYRPKPMVEIGGRPLLWHIMKIYSHHGVNDFIVCLGYKGYMIKEFFFNYYRHTADLQIDLGKGTHRVLNSQSEDWTVTLVDTGTDTMTGGRLKRVGPYLSDSTFCLTYGDGLADVDIRGGIDFHRRHGRLATVTAVTPPGRFGVLNLGSDSEVSSFEEKPRDETGWINGGFFVFERGILDYIDGDATSLEDGTLRRVARDGKLMAFQHHGFWQPCDTLRDKRALEALWSTGRAPWGVWQ